MGRGSDTGQEANERALRVLEFWHKVEFFIPYDLDSVATRKHTSWFTRKSAPQLPWLRAPHLNVQGDQELISCWLYLGVFNSDDIKHACRAVCPSGDSENPENLESQHRGSDVRQTCFARMKVSREGKPDFERVSISTLPWALGHLQNKRTEVLSSDAFLAAKQDLGRRLHNLRGELSRRKETDSDGLRASDLIDLVDTLFCWADFRPANPDFGNRPLLLVQEIWGSKPKVRSTSEPAAEEEDDDEQEQPDGIDILNSFYLEDLQQAIALMRSGKAPSCLEKYVLGSSAPRTDLYSPDSFESILEHLSPNSTARGRWITNCSQQMSLMQQFAINTVFKELNCGGVYSVNGPPGTGKTTMLKDLIAGNVVARARALAGFEKPEQAFQDRRIDVLFANGDCVKNVSLLNDAVTGFEMVVASANNAAVENVSRDFPYSQDEEWRAVSYLRPVACKIAAAEVDGAVAPLEDKLPWGLISAVLGKKANRQKFVRRFYNDPEPKDSEALNQRRKQGEYLNIRHWAKAYKGLTFIDARESFLAAERRVQEELAAIESLAEHYRKFDLAHEDDFTVAERERATQAEAGYQEAATPAAAADAKLVRIEEELAAFEREGELLDREKPDRLHALLFLSKKNLGYRAEVRENARRQRESSQQRRNVKRDLEDHLRPKLLAAEALSKRNRELLAAKQTEYRCGQHKLRLLAAQHPVRMPPHKSSDLERDDYHMQALWQHDRLNRLRSELFVAALQLHEAWLSECIRTSRFSLNCLALAKLLEGKRPLDPEHVLPIWQSLFLLVPVVSTTLASFHSMFIGLPPASLGWLFVDEAGQAAPQALVGAVSKMKRAVVIGDPMQIEPIFGVDIRLIWLLSEYSLDLIENFGPHLVSAQVLADRANRFGAWTRKDQTRLWVGSPLRVHRRCSDPMFRISNDIAYKGKMIQGKPAAANTGSEWFHVPGAATDAQYVEEQGRFVFSQILSKYAGGSGVLPSVYIISPFRRVAENLRSLIGDQRAWAKRLSPGQPVPSKKELSKWVQKRIGTVHTFQGKEEVEVFLVLGADWDSSGSARWAASKPNLLNVALTRARERIYVVGDRELWGKQKYFDQLAAQLAAAKAKAAS